MIQFIQPQPLSLNDAEPMIHTLKGNLFINDLDLQVTWEDVPNEYTKCIETYLLDGEIVRQSCHVLHRHGLNSGTTITPL
jgi:hypothetical protein